MAIAPAPRPVVAVGGNGVSGQSFVDNAAFRDFAHTAFAARALDMESAAVAQVAYAKPRPPSSPSAACPTSPAGDAVCEPR